MASAVDVADLSFTYPPGLPDTVPAPALQHVSLDVEAGQFLALMGPVGAGKTTLCHCLNGLIPQVAEGDFEGSVRVLGLDTRVTPSDRIAREVGMVFQDAVVQFFNASAEDEIAFALEGLQWAPADIERRIDWALEAVGLSGFRHRAPHALSGGEQKRLAISTVLAVAPPIFVLDEPTAGLDPRGRRDVMQVIDRLAAERHTTVIVATQDAEMVARHADRVIVLQHGQIALDGSPRAVFGQLAGKPEPCVSLPEIALAAHLLRQRAELQVDFLTVEEAFSALTMSTAESRA